MDKNNKMIIFFEETDLISFGNYLLSMDRKTFHRQLEEKYPNVEPLKDRLVKVNDIDVMNWAELRNKQNQQKQSENDQSTSNQ